MGKSALLTQQCHEEGRLPRSSRANDQVDLPALEEQLIVYGQHELPSVRPARST